MAMLTSEEIRQNLIFVKAQIAERCQQVGRTEDSVELVAVTKNFPVEALECLVSAGQLVFGENRVQEAVAKIEKLRLTSDATSKLSFHLIGHLQTNKVRKAVESFDTIQSVDSVALARKIDIAAGEVGKLQTVLLEVNVSGEESKFGFSIETLRVVFPQLNDFRHLNIVGLMTVAPYSTEPESTRPVFRQLRLFRDELERSFGVSLPELSMGMSGDFSVAIEECATIVRVGTALLGNRS
ncbi:MAG: YggS family pyridoxal phosphate-dependent enzyme [bacterium]